MVSLRDAPERPKRRPHNKQEDQTDFQSEEMSVHIHCNTRTNEMRKRSKLSTSEVPIYSSKKHPIKSKLHRSKTPSTSKLRENSNSSANQYLYRNLSGELASQPTTEPLNYTRLRANSSNKKSSAVEGASSSNGLRMLNETRHAEATQRLSPVDGYDSQKQQKRPLREVISDSWFFKDHFRDSNRERLKTFAKFAFNRSEDNRDKAENVKKVIANISSTRKNNGTMLVNELWSSKMQTQIIKNCNFDTERRKAQRFGFYKAVRSALKRQTSPGFSQTTAKSVKESPKKFLFPESNLQQSDSIYNELNMKRFKVDTIKQKTSEKKSPQVLRRQIKFEKNKIQSFLRGVQDASNEITEDLAYDLNECPLIYLLHDFRWMQKEYTTQVKLQERLRNPTLQ